jgi:hypothetical protein
MCALRGSGFANLMIRIRERPARCEQLVDRRLVRDLHALQHRRAEHDGRECLAGRARVVRRVARVAEEIFLQHELAATSHQQRMDQRRAANERIGIGQPLHQTRECRLVQADVACAGGGPAVAEIRRLAIRVRGLARRPRESSHLRRIAARQLEHPADVLPEDLEPLRRARQRSFLADLGAVGGASMEVHRVAVAVDQ